MNGERKTFMLPLTKECGFVDDKDARQVVVLAYEQNSLNNGEAGLFKLNGKHILKRYYKENGVTTLSEPNKEPIIVNETDEFIILGKAKSYYVSI